MAEDDGFDLISVSSDSDDDEIVIQAGARHAATQRRPQHNASAEPPRHARVGEDQAAPMPEDASDEPDLPAEDEPAAEDDPLQGLTEEEKLEYAKRMARKRKREEEAMVTTESDLHAKGPFSGMHALIVIIGIAIVAAGLAWYYFVYAA